MVYVPHTPDDRQQMLDKLGLSTVEELFSAIPVGVRFPEIDLPKPMSEMEILSHMREASENNANALNHACFLGAGAYHHFVPSVVDYVISRSEFLTAYTPYQPEVSQGTLQAIFEYQTMICALTGMEVSNASHYDGATATAEAAIMAMSATRGHRRRIVVSHGIHPEYLETLRTYTQGMEVTIVQDNAGARGLNGLVKLVDSETACCLIQSPDFYGRIQDLSGIAEQVHAQGALLAVISNPIALGMLRPPGDYDADIALGEGQPLGGSLSYGGPYLGFFAFKEALVRRSAGRLVGQTVDTRGERGYVLTLSTREQHIRREKATSNICTNQGLNALAASVYLTAMGKQGLRQVAHLCYHKAHDAAERIAALRQYQVRRSEPFFNEFVVRCPQPVTAINEALYKRHHIIGGLDLSQVGMGSNRDMLLCVTEMNSTAQVEELTKALAEVAR